MLTSGVEYTTYGFQLQPFVLHDLLLHAHTYTSVSFYVRGRGEGVQVVCLGLLSA